jgi:valyl-tRNA synthetase
MPYLTEELFQRLPHRAESRPESVCIAPFPHVERTYAAERVEEQLEQVLDVVKAFRSQLSALNVAKSANPQLAVRVSRPE